MELAEFQTVKEILAENFDDPIKPVTERRLENTLLLLPTDGGNTSRSKKLGKKRRKLNVESLVSETKSQETIREQDYSRIKKNAKVSFKDYIRRCRRSARHAKKVAYDHNLKTREALASYIRQHEPKLWEDMIHYEKFEPLNEKVWIPYVQELLGIPLKGYTDPSKLQINGMNAMMKLSMADYNGALLEVTRCHNKNMQGIEGIVLWDAQKTFIMVTKGKLVDEVKSIPKRGTVFQFQVPLNESKALQYSIFGDRFQYRSSDRAGRKFKSHNCDDLLYYLYDS